MHNLRKPIAELQWLQNELINPTHNLKIEDAMAKMVKLKEMKDDCRVIWNTPNPEPQKERDENLSARVSAYLDGVEASKKIGQEGSLLPPDFGIVLTQAMSAVLERLIG